MKIGIKLSFLLILALSVAACNGSKKTTEPQDTVVSEPEEQTSSDSDSPLDRKQVESGKLCIQMRKSACFGTCPVYTLKIFTNGRVEYHGDNHTEKLGVYSRVLSDEVYTNIARTFRLANLAQYDSLYRSGATDFPITSLTYHGKGFSKTIAGDFETPKAVRALENKLDTLANAGEWVQEEAQVPYGVIPNELIVELADGLSGERWVARHTKYSMELVRRIAPNLNLWLVRFDEKLIKPGKLIVELQRQKEVNKIEFNKRLQQRN